MGNILEFRRSEEAAIRTARPIQGSLGEIIIFPGVRIDRRATKRCRRLARRRVAAFSAAERNRAHQPDFL